MSEENDIKGKFHYVNSNRCFTCSKCRYFKSNSWSDRRTIQSTQKRCSIINKEEFELNDGDCPYSYNEYRVLNWYIYEKY